MTQDRQAAAGPRREPSRPLNSSHRNERANRRRRTAAMHPQGLLPTATRDGSRTRRPVGRSDHEAPDLKSRVSLDELDHQATGHHQHAYIRTDPKACAIEPATPQAEMRRRRWFRFGTGNHSRGRRNVADPYPTVSRRDFIGTVGHAGLSGESICQSRDEPGVISKLAMITCTSGDCGEALGWCFRTPKRRFASLRLPGSLQHSTLWQ
jgi:hypothetical protein